MSALVKIQKPTRAEVLERERLDRQAYFREIEQRMTVTLNLIDRDSHAHKMKKKAPSSKT